MRAGHYFVHLYNLDYVIEMHQFLYFSLIFKLEELVIHSNFVYYVKSFHFIKHPSILASVLLYLSGFLGNGVSII